MSSPITAKASTHRTLLGATCAAVSLFALASAANAAVLPPGGSSTTLTGNFSFAGETFITSQSQPFNDVLNGLNFNFVLKTTVYHNNTTLGTDFVYQLLNTAPTGPSGDFFDRLTVSSFSTYSVDADYDTLDPLNQGDANGTVAPWEVDRSGGTGTTVGFDFSHNPINPSQNSYFLIVRTNASTYQMGSATVIDNAQGSVIVNVPFGAIVGTPEPASIGILAASLGLLVRRRRSVK